MCEIADSVIFIFLGTCGIFDCRKKEIPVALLIIMSIAVLIFAVCCEENDIWTRAVGALIGVLFFVISKLTKEAIGYGDSWLILLLGIHLGSLVALQVLFAASFAAGLCSLFYLWIKGWKKRTTLPFVPFMAAAYLGVIFI